jgi:C-terminal processing protease CtpA/Prc
MVTGGYRPLRRYLLLVAAALLACVAHGAPPKKHPAASPEQQRAHAADFDALSKALETSYPFRDRGAWKRAKAQLRQRARLSATAADFLTAIESAMLELRDDAVTLSSHSKRSGRTFPYEADVFARWIEGEARVEGVRISGEADAVGLRPGHVVTRLEGVPTDKAVAEYLKGGVEDDAARDWALRKLLAGPRVGPQLLEVREGDLTRTITIQRGAATPNASPGFLARRIGDKRDIAYVRMRIGSPDTELLPALDDTLPRMADTRGMILDIRENAAPGSSAFTNAVLARFDPASGAYRAPLVVLVDHWTAREGEALASGLVRVAHATLIGTPTAGLPSEGAQVKLPHSGIIVSFPTKRPEPLQPAIAVDLAAPSGGPGDPILYQGLKALEALPARAGRNGSR